MKDLHPPDSALDEVVAAEQLRAHYSQLPAIAVAPAVGALYSAWVLWGAVDDRLLVLGVIAVFLVSTVRLVVYWRFFRQPPERMAATRWRFAAVAAALVSGCVWGSAAPLLYPPHSPDYVVFLVVLLALLPVAPVAALAAYMPAFTAYFSCCMLPFIATLALHDSRAERLAAVLLILMMGAIWAFARRYSQSLREATRLRVHLARQSSSLEEALAHKSHFIAAASHDLRQPVHAMGLLVESLRERAQRQAQAGHESDAQTDSILMQMDASMHNLRGMLDLSRLDADVVQPRVTVFALADLIERLSEEYAACSRAGGLRVRRRCGPAWVRTDPALLERILRNLLSNALNYTAGGGVLLAARARGPGVQVLVIDTGPGIRAEDQRRVFDEFVRIETPDSPDSPDAPGMGLGLAIVRRLAALLGHRVWLQSRVGHGSTSASSCRWCPPALPRLRHNPAKHRSSGSRCRPG
jgi:signal transduction histidine kinase